LYKSSEDDTKTHVNLYRWSFRNNSEPLFDVCYLPYVYLSCI